MDYGVLQAPQKFGEEVCGVSDVPRILRLACQNKPCIRIVWWIRVNTEICEVGRRFETNSVQTRTGDSPAINSPLAVYMNEETREQK